VSLQLGQAEPTRQLSSDHSLGHQPGHHPVGPVGLIRPPHDLGDVDGRYRAASEGIDQSSPALTIGTGKVALGRRHPG